MLRGKPLFAVPMDSCAAVAGYREAGHCDAWSNFSEQCDVAHRCDVVICVRPGPVFRLGKVTVTGSTGEDFDAQRYLKAIALRSGALYSDAALSKARKRVLLTPGVSDVTLSTSPAGDGRIDVHYEISFEPPG